MRLSILLTPLARGAWFAQAHAVALAELRLHFPAAEPVLRTGGGLDLVDVDLPEAALPQVARLACVQGVFARDDGGLRPLLDLPRLSLPDGLVYGAKYRGKTNELVTQLALNVALAHAAPDPAPRVLDPMAGRGTTLLWALRYGLDARGIERDPRAIDDLQRHVRRQTKLHRLKHRLTVGQIGKKRRDQRGRFLELTLGGPTLRLVTGDSRDARELLNRERYTAVVTDLPYGIQHTGPRGKRDPLDEVAACAPGWAESLRPGGCMVLVFNALLPRREALVRVIAATGLVEQPFRVPHRMSESILRDLAVFTTP